MEVGVWHLIGSISSIISFISTPENLLKTSKILLLIHTQVIFMMVASHIATCQKCLCIMKQNNHIQASKNHKCGNAFMKQLCWMILPKGFFSSTTGESMWTATIKMHIFSLLYQVTRAYSFLAQNILRHTNPRYSSQQTYFADVHSKVANSWKLHVHARAFTVILSPYQ